MPLEFKITANYSPSPVFYEQYRETDGHGQQIISTAQAAEMGTTQQQPQAQGTASNYTFEIHSVL